MANDCSKHAGQHNASWRENLEDLMRSLPKSQSGDGRHKCAYCAYEQGYADGLRLAGDSLRTMLLREAGLIEKKEL